MNKYRNKRMTIFGHTFDSKLEAERYLVLLDAQKRGEIRSLQTQIHFNLIPAQTVNGRHFRKSDYIADFVYMSHGKIVVEDAKGYETDVYRLKEKLMADRHKIAVKKVYNPADPIG